jgi:Cu-Zn family superoxide dismutase
MHHSTHGILGAAALAASLGLAATAFAQATHTAEKKPTTGETAPRAAAPDGDGDSATATLVDRAGKRVGLATLEGTPNGTVITVDVEGLPPGPHGFHIHEVGKCEPPFESARDHFNPTNAGHGIAVGKGYHAGDLPNLFVPESGKTKAQMLAPHVTVRAGATSVFDADGSTLIIHAERDDLRTDPAGRAGDRIACGVIER